MSAFASIAGSGRTVELEGGRSGQECELRRRWRASGLVAAGANLCDSGLEWPALLSVEHARTLQPTRPALQPCVEAPVEDIVLICEMHAHADDIGQSDRGFWIVFALYAWNTR